MRYMSVSNPWTSSSSAWKRSRSRPTTSGFPYPCPGAAHARFLTPEAKDFSSFGKLGAERRQSTSSATASPLAACGNHSAASGCLLNSTAMAWIPRSTPALLGPPMQNFLHNLADAGRGGEFQTHFVTAREMTNLILAACDEKNGDPCMFRDYSLRPII